MDELRKETDKQLERMERKIAKTYREAETEIEEKWKQFMKRSEGVLREQQDALALARKSGDEEAIRSAEKAYRQACIEQTLGNKQYKAMVDATTDRIAHANELALDYINEEMPHVYRYNYNGTGKLINEDIRDEHIGGVSFNLIDENTAKLLMKDNKSLLPKKLDVPADKRWNTKAINAQVLQGIIQGESIPKIAQRLQNVTDMDEKAAIRNARTMTTNAENAGRVDSMKEAESLGLEYEKVWMATHDERTRESHAMLDGVSIPLDEEFANGLQWAGDANGEPAEVYNCRCSVVRKLIGYKGHRIDAPSYDPDYFD